MIISIFLILIFLDQVSKFLADYFGMSTLNTGVSFGMGEGWSWMIMIALHGTVLILVWWGLTNSKFKCQMSNFKEKHIATLILAGGVSNIIDRIVFGGVRDWLGVPFIDLTNNLADWFVFIGVVFLIYELGIMSLKE